MTHKVDDFLSQLVGGHYLNSSSDRFQWCQGQLIASHTENGPQPPPFHYCIDTIHKTAYIAYSPSDRGVQLLMGALATPCVCVGRLIVQLTKLATTCLMIAYHVFHAVYPDKDSAQLAPKLLDSFEASLEKQKEVIQCIATEMFTSLQNALGLEITAFYGIMYRHDPQISAKMQAIWAALENKWNGGVDYHHTPITYAIQLKKALDTEATCREAFSQLTWSQMVPSFYILQQYQARNMQHIRFSSTRYDSYEAMQIAHPM